VLVEPSLVHVLVGNRTWSLEAVGDQDSLLAGVVDDEQLAAFPYGLILWPAASALATWLDHDRSWLAGRRILEIGSGIGLAGLVAASHGASVVQTDWQPAVLELAAKAADRNHVDRIERRIGDWRAWPDDLTGFDAVIGSDIFYERSVHDNLTALLPRLIRPGGEIRITDPLRPQAFDLLDRWEREKRFRIELERLGTTGDNTPKEIMGIRLTLP